MEVLMTKEVLKKNTKRQDAMDSITASPKAAENLKQLSGKYKNDEDFLLDAIEKQPAVYMYVDKKFKNDPEFVRKAIVRNPDVLGHMGNSEEQSVTDINSAYYYLDLVKGDEEKTERLKKHFSADVINKLEEASRPLDRGSASRRRVKEKTNNQPVDKEKEKATSKLWNLIYNSSLDSAVGKNGKTLRTIFEEIYNEAEEVAGADKYDMVMNSLTRELAEQFGAEYVKDLGKQSAALTKLLNDANVDLGKKNVQGQGLAYIFATKSKNPYVWWVLKTNGKLDISDAEMKKIEKVKSADPIFVAEIKKYKEQKENERTTQNTTVDSAQSVAQQGSETVQVTEPAKPKENNGQTEQTVVTPKEETAEATAEGTEKKKGLFERLKARMQQRKSDKATNKLYKLLTKGPFNKDDKEEADRLIKEEGANIKKAVLRMSKQNRYPDEAWAYLTEKLPELKEVEEKLKPKSKEGNNETVQAPVETPKEEAAEATAEGTGKKKGLFERLKERMQQRKSDKNQQKLNKLLIKALKADEFDKNAVEDLIQLGADITDPKIIKSKTKYSYNAQVFLDYQKYLKKETAPVSEATYKLYKLLTKETFDEDDKKEADRLIKVEGANVYEVDLPSTLHDKFSSEAEKYIEEKELEKFYTEKAEAELKDKEDVNKQLDAVLNAENCDIKKAVELVKKGARLLKLREALDKSEQYAENWLKLILELAVIKGKDNEIKQKQEQEALYFKFLKDAKEGNIDAVKEAIDKGVNVDVNWAFLDYLAQQNTKVHTEIQKMIIEAQKKKNKRQTQNEEERDQ